MSENDAERQVRGFLEAERFQVERIPSLPHEEQRADYRVIHENEIHIVEVKGRIENQKYVQDLLKKGEAIKESIVGRTNPVSKHIREAAEQLKTTPAESSAFRVIALVTADDDSEVHSTQFQSTLYGMVDLLVPAKDGSAVAVPCFYFTFNEFFNLRYVDAVLILMLDGSRICLNSFSSRAHEFRRTWLYQLHSRAGAVCDPEEMEIQRKAFVADCRLASVSEPVSRPVAIPFLQDSRIFSPTKRAIFCCCSSSISSPSSARNSCYLYYGRILLPKNSNCFFTSYSGNSPWSTNQQNHSGFAASTSASISRRTSSRVPANR